MRPLAAARGDPRSSPTAPARGDAYVFADRQRLKQVLLNLLSNAVKYNRAGRDASPSSCERARRRHGCVIEVDRHRRRHPHRATSTGCSRRSSGSAPSRPTSRAPASGSRCRKRPGRGDGRRARRRARTLGAGQHLLGRAARCVEGHRRAARPAPRRVHHCRRWRRRRERPRRLVLYIEDNLANLTPGRADPGRAPSARAGRGHAGRLGLELAAPAPARAGPARPAPARHPRRRGAAAAPRRRAHRAIPVVMVSADATEASNSGAWRAGARAYVTKPIDVDELLAVLDDTLARAGR